MAKTQNSLDNLTKAVELFNGDLSSDEEKESYNEPHREYPKRNIPKVSYTEESITEQSITQKISCNEDDFFYCEDCRQEYDKCCPDHGPFLHVMDREVLPGPNPKLAWDTCPDFLSICNSGIKGAGLGIWTEIDLPKGVMFGPYKGIIVKSRKQVQQSGYAWEIRQRGSPFYYIESTDPSASNWLRFVNCAPTEDRQNLIAFQYAGHIFYKTYKHISAYTELLIWYGDDFGIDLGIAPIEEPTSEKGGYSCKKNIIGTSSNRGSNIHQKLKCNIEDEGRINPGCKAENLLSRKDATEPNQKESQEGIKAKNDMTGLQCVSFEDSFSTRLPLGEDSGQCENLLNDVLCAEMCDSNIFQSEIDCVMMKLIEGGNELCNTDKKLLACPDCSYRAKYKCEIRWHIGVVHAGKKPYKCPHCDHRTSRAAHLKEHLSAVHAGKKPYKCPQCNHSTTYLSNLKEHIDVVHVGRKPYKCPHCNHRTAKSSDLSTHIDAIHAKKRPHKCSHCDYSAARRGDLKRHLDARHS